MSGPRPGDTYYDINTNRAYVCVESYLGADELCEQEQRKRLLAIRLGHRFSVWEPLAETS